MLCTYFRALVDCRLCSLLLTNEFFNRPEMKGVLIISVRLFFAIFRTPYFSSEGIKLLSSSPRVFTRIFINCSKVWLQNFQPTHLF